jgi:hypothetical protein
MVLVIEIQGAAGQDIDERTRELGFWSETGLGSARVYQAAIPQGADQHASSSGQRLYFVRRSRNHEGMPPTHQASVKIEGKGSHGSSTGDAQMKVQSKLDLVHWHMIRGDGLRASLVNRAGSVLSTNGLIVAGVALAVGFRNQHPNLAALTAALGALVCIAVSVLNASMGDRNASAMASAFQGNEYSSAILVQLCRDARRFRGIQEGSALSVT